VLSSDIFKLTNYFLLEIAMSHKAYILIYSLVGLSFFSHASENKITRYSDGEVREVISATSKTINTRVPRNPDQRILSQYSYKNHQWLCDKIETFTIDKKVIPQERIFVFNKNLIDTTYCDSNGNQRIKDYYHTNLYKREILEAGKVFASFEYIYEGSKIIGFDEKINKKNHSYRKNIDLNSNFLRPDQDSFVKVMVVDSGIDYSHPGFANRIASNLNQQFFGHDLEHRDHFVEEAFGEIPQISLPLKDKDITAEYLLPNFHGTHVASIVTQNSINASIIPVRGDYLTASFWSEIGDSFRRESVDILNMSAGITIVMNDPDYARFHGLQSTIKKNDGILFVFPSGNDGMDVDRTGHTLKVVPATYREKNMLTVAASAGNELTSFSNSGINSVHVAAPGKDILAARPGGSYIKHSGTSMASPMVAGMAADIKGILLHTSWGGHHRNSSEMVRLIKVIIMSTVTINFKKILPVRSGGIVNPLLASDLAYELSQLAYMPDEQDVYIVLEKLLGRVEVQKRKDLWTRRGGLL
jgi:hypothetical protein